MITFDDLKKIELRVGQVVSAVPVEGSEKLILLSVDFGEESPRTVVSGIAKFVDIASLVGTQKVFVTNLEPRPIMGIESQAMLLAGKDEVDMALVTMDRPIKNGTILS